MVVNPISDLAHVGTVRAETRMLCGLVFRSPAASQCWLIWAQGFHGKTVQPNKGPSDPHICVSDST